MRDAICKEAKPENCARRYYVGQMGVSVVTMTQVVRALIQQVRAKTPAYVCAANLEAAVLAQRDAVFCAIQNGSLLTLPDGMPLVWYARVAGESAVERVTGPDLLVEVLRTSREHGLTHYFYGDTEQTLVSMAEVARIRFPGAVIKRLRSPPFRELRPEEFREVVDDINRLKPSFVWVALGCPKQERWMAKALPHVESSVLIGVGAAFRFLIGYYRHPPRVIQSLGLEGVFWRAWRYPVYSVKWYCYHTLACGPLLLEALAKRMFGSVAWRRHNV